MQSEVEYLLSEEVSRKFEKPYFSMSLDEIEEVKNCRRIYSNLNRADKEKIREVKNSFFIAKIEEFYLDFSLENVLGDLVGCINSKGSYYGTFENLEGFCLSNNIDYANNFRNIYEELDEVKKRRGNREFVPLYDIQSVKKVIELYFGLRGEAYKEEYVSKILEKTLFSELDANLLFINEKQNKVEELSESQKLSMLFFTSKTGILEFLKTKPEKVVYKDFDFKLGPLINHLSFNQIDELFEEIDDDTYIGRLLLSANVRDVKELLPYFNKIDDYNKTQIVCAKHAESTQDTEMAESKIRNYGEIKRKLLSLPKEERADFLANLEETDTKVYEGIGSYRDNNEIKKSLLSYIDSPEDREKVVASLKRKVAPELESYVETAEKMIEEFFDNHGGLSSEEKERMQIALKSIDFDLESYSKDSTCGTLYNLYHFVSISKDNMDNPSKTLFYVLHEMSHVMSLSNFRQDLYHAGDAFEEGMADTFAQITSLEYISKHGDIEFGEGKVNKDSINGILESTGYEIENGWTRSILYVLQKQGKDFSAVREFLLGKKSNFFEMAFGKETMKAFETNHNGDPLEVGFTHEEFYELFEPFLQDIDTGSMYYGMNFLLRDINKEKTFGNRLSDCIVGEKITLDEVEEVAKALDREMNFDKNR